MDRAPVRDVRQPSRPLRRADAGLLSGRTSATIRTARSRNSGGYTLGRPIAGSSQFQESPDTLEVSNRP